MRGLGGCVGDWVGDGDEGEGEGELAHLGSASRLALAFRASSVSWLIFFQRYILYKLVRPHEKKASYIRDFEQKFQNFRLAYHRKGLLPIGILNQNSERGFILH